MRQAMKLDGTEKGRYDLLAMELQKGSNIVYIREREEVTCSQN